MKITNLVYTVLVSSILIFSPSLSLSQAHFTTAPVGEATPLPDGFCCTNGQVISTGQAQCKKRGQYYQTRAEALRHCRPNKVFCCINGKVSEISPEQCKRSQGTAYSTDTEAKRKCKSKAIYCCCNSKIVKVSPEDCKISRGTAYTTSSEAERKCKSEEVYCCLQGKIKKTSPEDCKKHRGILYKTTAEAKRKCKPETVFCCLKGSIKKTSSTECKTKKGAPYRTEREARKNCGWCCAESKIFPTTPEVCKKKRGIYFTSKVQADQQCKEQPQCCIKGKLFTCSKRECDNKKGKYYRSYVEAKHQCRFVVGNARLKASSQSVPGGVKSPGIELSSPMTIKNNGRRNTSSDLPPVGGGLDVPIIVVVNKTVVPQDPNLDQEVTASFTVKNIGSVATSGPLPFLMKIYSSDESGIQTLGGSSVYQWHFDLLEPGDEQTISLSGSMFHLGLHVASLEISRNGSSVPGGYSEEIVIPSEPTYQFFQVLQPYDLGFYGSYGCFERTSGGIRIRIKNYGPDIPQEQHDRLGVFLMVNNDAMQTMPMTIVDPNGRLKNSGQDISFVWPWSQIIDGLKGDWPNRNKRDYRVYIGVLTVDGGGTTWGAVDSHPGNNNCTKKVGGYNDLVVCFKKYVYHTKPLRFRYYDVKVKNIGNLPSDFSDLKFYIEKKGTTTYSIPSLNPGEEYSITRKVYWGKKGIRKFKLEVKSSGNLELRALNENWVNNIFKGKIYIKKDPPGPGTVQCSDHPDAANLW